jgi:hypothetical protein
MNSSRDFPELGNNIPRALFNSPDSNKEGLVRGVVDFLSRNRNTDRESEPGIRDAIGAVQRNAEIVRLIERDIGLLNTFIRLNLSRLSADLLKDNYGIVNSRKFADEILGVLRFYMTSQDITERLTYDPKIVPTYVTNNNPTALDPDERNNPPTSPSAYGAEANNARSWNMF